MGGANGDGVFAAAPFHLGTCVSSGRRRGPRTVCTQSWICPSLFHVLAEATQRLPALGCCRSADTRRVRKRRFYRVVLGLQDLVFPRGLQPFVYELLLSGARRTPF